MSTPKVDLYPEPVALTAIDLKHLTRVSDTRVKLFVHHQLYLQVVCHENT